MKYNEDKILKEIGDYIKSTYGQHYSTGKDGFQVQDLFKTRRQRLLPRQCDKISLISRNDDNRADLLANPHVILLLNYEIK